MSYAKYEPSLVPTPLQDPYGQAFLRAMGLQKDSYVFQAKQAVGYRFPDFAPPDALSAIGRERLIDQGIDPQLSPSETSAAYAARLKDAWNIWLKGGTAWGMLIALAAQGYTGAHVLQQNGLDFSLSGGNLVITTVPIFRSGDPFSRFLVYFPSPPSSWTNIVNPPTPSSAPTLQELRKLRRIINLWKPACALCYAIGVVTSGAPAYWGQNGAQWGTGHWGGGITWFSATDYATWDFPFSDAWNGALPGTWDNNQV